MYACVRAFVRSCPCDHVDVSFCRFVGSRNGDRDDDEGLIPNQERLHTMVKHYCLTSRDVLSVLNLINDGLLPDMEPDSVV